MRFAISKNFCSVPAGIVAPAAAWWPPPNPPTALLASCMTAARSSPRATRSRVVLAVAAANAVADLRLVVAATGIHERPELLRVPRRASRGFPNQGVRLAGKPFRFLRPAAAFEHVRDERGHDPPFLSVVQVRPTPP